MPGNNNNKRSSGKKPASSERSRRGDKGKPAKKDGNIKVNRAVYQNQATQNSTLGTGAGIIAIIAVLAAMAAFITPAGNGFIDFFNLQGFYAGMTWVLVGICAAGISWVLAVHDERRGKL